MSWPLRAVIELGVIVVGVLIALSADAWLASRAEQRAEAQHLSAILGDLEESKALLESSNAERDRVFYSLERLLNTDLETAPVDTVSSWVFEGFFNVGSYTPRLSSLRDLQESDATRVLPASIRVGIAELDRRLRDLESLEEDFVRSQQGLLDPYLVAELPLAPVAARADSLPIVDPAVPHWDALYSEEARNLMAFKLSLGKIGTTERTGVFEQLELLLDLVAARLDEVEGRGSAG